MASDSTPEERTEQRTEERAEKLAERVEERAEKLAERVEEQAQAQTERVEQRAKVLADTHAEERLADRMDGRVDIRTELVGITSAINLLVEHMEQSIPPERVQAVLDAALTEERISRKRLAAAVIGPLVIVIAIVTSSWFQARDGATVANYVDHCLVHPVKATPGECGNTAATGQQSAAVVAIFCYLQIHPELRNDANARECFAKAQAATTTTTGKP